MKLHSCILFLQTGNLQKMNKYFRTNFILDKNEDGKLRKELKYQKMTAFDKMFSGCILWKNLWKV